MTNNNAFKKTIRERMQQTGESYNVAARKLQEQRVNPTVIELGDEDDAWLVTGVNTPQEAFQLIREWLIACYPDPTSRTRQELLSYLDDYCGSKLRHDWFWVPLEAEYPEGDALLRYASKPEVQHNNEPLFTAFYIH